MTGEVKQFPIREAADDQDAVIANLTAAMEQMDQGMKMALDLLVQYDQRIRALELAQRKADKQNVPVIVDRRIVPAN